MYVYMIIILELLLYAVNIYIHPNIYLYRVLNKCEPTNIISSLKDVYHSKPEDNGLFFIPYVLQI